MRHPRLEGLGIRALVNAEGAYTRLGGSRLAPGVIDAMAEVSKAFVPLEGLARAVEARIAALTGNEACHVTSGAAAGIAISVAACVAGVDPVAIADLPSAAAGREVVLQRGQRNGFEQAARMTGATLVEVGGADAAPSRGELAAALGPRAACVLVFAGTPFEPALPLPELIEVAHAAGVPVVVDAAALIPPISSLSWYSRALGADLVVFSGGKGLRGPQTTGIIVGSPARIAACIANDAPRMAFGRPMKVGKEELLGILAAVEWALAQDEGAARERHERQVQAWLDALADQAGVQVSRCFPGVAGEPVPRALVRFRDPARCHRVIDELLAGEPPIAVGSVGEDALAVDPRSLDDDEAELVLDRIRAALATAAAIQP